MIHIDFFSFPPYLLTTALWMLKTKITNNDTGHFSIKNQMTKNELMSMNSI